MAFLIRVKSILIIAIFLSPVFGSAAQPHQDYMKYHLSIISAEELIAQKEYSAALTIFESIFNSYDFIFLRDYKVATQLALYLGDRGKALKFIKLGISAGWTIKEIKRNKFLRPLQKMDEWKIVRSQYDSLHLNYRKGLNQTLRVEVHKMFKKDQKLAFVNVFKIRRKAKERFLCERFIPQSEGQIIRLKEIMNVYGYPGEKLIGNWLWMWTILSHHNSISTEYVRKDTLYPSLSPQLLEAIRLGELSPYDYAVIEDWYFTVKSDHKVATYGFLNKLTREDLPGSNKLRQRIGMRSVDTRNLLVDIQDQTGMDFYLAGELWGIKKIIIH